MLVAAPAWAGALHGLVYDDVNGDGLLSADEPGVASAVVAFGTRHFVTTDASGHFEIRVAHDERGIVWVRVPDGFVPGPVWARWDGTGDVELGLRRLAKPVRGPVTFVVGADSHLGIAEPNLGADDLARAARQATTLDPPPAFFTIVGDVTQGGRAEQYALVDRALAGLGVPWIPVPGNHDWYDGGAAWFEHYGPDNYSFDIGGVHFVVWNMALPPDELRAYLGAELSRVAKAMPIVALTHDPPLPPTVAVLRELGVDYVLTGHTHSNRVIDHGGLVELGTEPLLMGGLDFTPAGYRVVTIGGGRLASHHHTIVDEPVVALVAPSADECAPARGGELLVAAELAGGSTVVSARLDCARTFELRRAGGWIWRADLPALAPGDHLLELAARGSDGNVTTRTETLRVCSSRSPAAVDRSLGWPQAGGSATHTGRVAHEIRPPLVTRWVAALGNHVLTAAPIIAGGTVYVATTDLADGDSGGVSALDLATGAVHWRVSTRKPIRGGVAFAGGLVVTTQIDGEVLALDAATGAVRWRRALSRGVPPQAGAVFSPPTAAASTLFLGHQRAAGALDAETGRPRWLADPVPDGFNSQSAAAIAIGSGLAVGTFQRTFGGVIAWDASTGAQRWRYEAEDSIAINAAPVIGTDSIYLVDGATEVIALDLEGNRRWRTKLDAQGFEWGHASVGTPALAGDTLVVPTLYGSLVALDTRTGAERWRYRARSGPLRGTHYRGSGVPAFTASPVVTGNLVWAADTSGLLSALDLRTGLVRWFTELPTPVMAGLAASGDWLVVASYDGTVRALAPGAAPSRRAPTPELCAAEPTELRAGCCNASGGADTASLLAIVLGYMLRRRKANTRWRTRA